MKSGVPKIFRGVPTKSELQEFGIKLRGHSFGQTKYCMHHRLATNRLKTAWNHVPGHGKHWKGLTSPNHAFPPPRPAASPKHVVHTIARQGLVRESRAPHVY